MKKIISLLLILSFTVQTTLANKKKILKIGIVGLTHTHVHWLLGRKDLGDVKIVGIVEPNKELAARYLKQYGMSMELVYNNLEEMLKACKPEAVAAFGSIYEHLEVVETCAPRGIHVMVEKPLAVSLEHAKKMKALAEKHKIHLLTNYETTWYSTNHKAYELLNKEKKIGKLRKVVVHDGHQGPKEIGVNKEFLDWLTDPVKNGGGAITDFGCYGANLLTWLTKGERPISVFAVTQQIKPTIYPKVDDEATIVIAYKNAQGIIQASWNWPFSRKDMEVYGQTGYLISENRNNLQTRFEGEKLATRKRLEERKYPYNDPFAFFAAVIHNEIKMKPYDLSSLENNLMVMEILDAAIRSAKSGKRTKLQK